MFQACYNCQYMNIRMSLCNGCLIQQLLIIKKESDHGLMYYYMLKSFLVNR